MNTAKAGMLALAMLSLSIAATPACPANTTVYRCLDAHLDVVYTDTPCKDGAPLEIRTGEADPAALARLERARDALDQAASQRITEERRLAAQRVVPVPMARENAPEPEDNYGYGYGGYYGYPVGGYFPRHPIRDRDREHVRPRLASRGGAPPPPYIVPRP